MSIAFDLYAYKLSRPEACLIWRDKPERKSIIHIPDPVSDKHQHASTMGYVIQFGKAFQENNPNIKVGDVISFTLTAPNIAFPQDCHDDARNYFHVHFLDALGVMPFESLSDQHKDQCREILKKWNLQPAAELKPLKAVPKIGSNNEATT